MLLRYSLLLYLPTIILSQLEGEYSAQNFPNPKKISDAKLCNMRSISSVCDPYSVLTESERYRLNHELVLMAQRTERVEGDFCDRRGFEPTLLVVQEGSQQLVDDINKRWNLDGQCKKAVIFLLSATDHQLYYSTEEKTNFDQQQFITLKATEDDRMYSGQYTAALVHIFKQIGGAKNVQAATFDRDIDYKNRQQGQPSSNGEVRPPSQPKKPKFYVSAATSNYLTLGSSFLIFLSVFML